MNRIREEIKTGNTFIYLIEDGKDIKTANLFELNLHPFYNKYEFKNQKYKLDLNILYDMKLKQNDFDNRAFMELLEEARSHLHGITLDKKAVISP